MKKTIYLSVIFFFLILTFQSSSASGVMQENTQGWKAGVAKVKITPEESLWLAGYAARNHPSEGVLHDLWSKALAIEDSKGKKAVLITNDLVEIPKTISDRIRNRIGAKYGLTRSQIILNCSHTHSGPVLYDDFSNIYPLNDDQLNKVKSYSAKFENQIVDLAGQAIASMKPANIFAENGVTRFQVNRRNNVESLSTQINDLKGPNEYSVPVIKVVNEAGELMAVAFGYACHATVLSNYQFSGDYPGFAQIELEKSHPGVIALFFQGAGADQNPLPRRTIPLAQQYGRQLAAAVERILSEDMRKLNPVLATAYSEIDLQYAGPTPSKEELMKIMEPSSSTPDYLKRSAKCLLQRLEWGEILKNTYPYPCQVWKLGDQALMALGGELLIEYAIELKKVFGFDIFVLGYSNDVMAYIPSETVLKEGGYEGTRSPVFTTAWNMNIESVIIGEMNRLAKIAGVQPKK
jgi:neutral ceramidase